MASFIAEQDGDWTTPATWGEATEYPGKSQDDDTSDIRGFDVTYNLGSSGRTTYRLGKITASASNTKLIFSSTQYTYLWIRGDTTCAVDIYNGGIVELASESSPLSSDYTCTIEIDQATDSSGSIFYCGNSGVPSIFGMVKTLSGFSSNAITADTSSSFTMSSVPSDWAVDDELVIQDTADSYSVNENEEVLITSISGTTVNFSGNGAGDNAEFSHLSGAIILNLTRNVKIIATSTSTRADRGFYAENSSADLRYIDFNGCTYQDHGGAWAFSTQDGTGRSVYIEGCVTRNQSDGCYMQGSGHKKYHKIIVYNNADKGIDGANDWGVVELTDSFIVGNNSYGFSGDNRGTLYENNNYYWNNQYAINISGNLLSVGSCFFGHSQAAIRTGSSRAVIEGGVFGESPAGTQKNLSSIKCRYAASICNDCKFSDTTPFQEENIDGEIIYSSNHNQVAGALLIQYSISDETVETDTTLYRTTSPSIKLVPARYGNFVVYKIPVKCVASTALSIAIQGKKSSTTIWKEPKAVLSGCGLSDSGEWDTNDTNWNSLTLSGTPTRSGMAMIIVTAYSEQFNIDDIVIS